MAITPSNAPAMANADLNEEENDLRKTCLGTDNYLTGVKMAEEAMS